MTRHGTAWKQESIDFGVQHAFFFFFLNLCCLLLFYVQVSVCSFPHTVDTYTQNNLGVHPIHISIEPVHIHSPQYQETLFPLYDLCVIGCCITVRQSLGGKDTKHGKGGKHKHRAKQDISDILG